MTKNLGQMNLIDGRQRAALWRIVMLRKNGMESLGRSAIWQMLILGLIGMILPCMAKASPNMPAVVVTSTSTVTSGLPNNESAAAVDACGNIYTVNGYGSSLYETSADGGAITTVYSIDTWGYVPANLWMDAAKANLYVTGAETSTLIPIVNCAPDTANETQFSIGDTGAPSYYFWSSAIAANSSGSVFIATGSECCASPNELIQENSTSTSGYVWLAGLPSDISSMTIDSLNNIYFASGGQVFELPYNAASGYPATPVSFGSTYNNVTGVSLDAVGNLYITDNGAGVIYEIPYESTALNPNDQFTVVSNSNAYSNLAQGAAGTFAYTSNGTTAYTLTIGSANLGSVAAGTSSSTTLTVQFNAAETLKSLSLTTANSAYSITGGTCAAGSSVAVGGSCTVQVTFTPSVPGLSASALTITNSSGAVLSETYLSGVSTAPGLTIDPGTVSALGSGYTSPNGVAVDVASNLYAADSGANKVYEFAVGSSAPLALGSELSGPEGVAVDGAGNLFIADTGNGRIVEIPVVNGQLSTAAQTVIVSPTAELGGNGKALLAPAGIAVDGSGNLYIADTGNKRVLFVPYNGSTWVTAAAFTLGSNMTSPSAVALDSTGNVYVADSGSGNVYKLQLPLSAPLQTTVVSGYSKPSGVAVDPSGALFVVDQGDKSVWRIPNLAGVLTSTSAVNVVSQLNSRGLAAVANPFGVALDEMGNAYVTDAADSAVYMITRTSSTQSVGTWAPGSSSSPVSFSLENDGNSTLTLGQPYETASGSVSMFSLDASGVNACANGASVTPGSNCDVYAVFAPSSNASGSYSYSLALSSNAANASNQSITYTGTSEITAATTTTIAQSSPSGPPAFDQAVSFTVTVASVQSANGTPVGPVSLIVDGTTKQTVLLSDGSATFTLAAGVLSGGSHTIQANFLGGNSANGQIAYSLSSSSPLTLNVTTVTTVTDLSYATEYVSPNSQPAGTGLVITATVSSTVAGTPTGSVTFTITDSAGNVTTGMGTLTATSAGNQASYTYTPAAPSGGAQYIRESVTATYSGDINFSASTSAASAFFVAPALGSVVIANNGLSLTTSSASSGSVTFNMNSYGGWTGIVGFTCDPSTLPANATCLFQPGQVSVLPNTPTSIYPPDTVKLTVATNQPPEAAPTPSTTIWWISFPAGLLLLVMRRRMKLALAATGWNLLLLLAAVGVLSTGLLSTTACTNTAFATPKGTSTVTVYAWVDPYQSGSSSKTQTCGINSTTNKVDPTLAPCSQQAFNIQVTVQ